MIGELLRWTVRHPQPVMVLLIIVGTGAGVWHLMTRSRAFEVTTIQLPPQSSLQVPTSVLGSNLWTVDVQALARHLKTQDSQAKYIRVLRQPPHTLQIEVQDRRPLAQLRLDQWYQVAGDGFILSRGHAQPWEHLPVIAGVGDPKTPLKVGQENASPRLHQALRLVVALRRSAVLRGRQLTQVDVSHASGLTFVMDDALEVRCGSESELRRSLERLQTVLRVVTRQSVAARYVDVRFRDPVIGPTT